MDIKRCDRCGKESEKYSNEVGLYKSKRHGEYHLCESCGDDLDRVIGIWFKNVGIVKRQKGLLKWLLNIIQ